jgi:hypothetical protein
MRRLLALLAAAQVAVAPVPAYAAVAAWEPGPAVAGVFDVDGPRSDGSLIVAGAAALYLMNSAGKVAPFARGPGGYHEDKGAEAYLANSPGGSVSAAGCSFARDETFVLRLHVPIGVNRVSASGDESGSFANVQGVTTLNGIAFDTTGAFDDRLLVSGPAGGKTVIFAIDCNGVVSVITRSAPRLEGGLAVAPTGFGQLGGQLIAADELSGKIYAITATGAVSVVAKPKLPTGGDVGVESVGFVPAGFISRGGVAYYADRFTKGNAHPGTDHLLRLPSAQLAAAGVQDGDMLVATEGGATMVAVRCAPACTTIPVVAKATRAHGEGHLAFTVNQPPLPTPIPNRNAASDAPQWGASLNAPITIGLGVLVVLAVLAGAGTVVILRRRRRRRA